jgi:hypothetical protein
MRGYDITPEQRDDLVRAYVANGTAATAPLAAKYGVCRKYPSILARERGLSHCYGDPNSPRVKKATRADDDHRWRWAIERGAVIA